SSLAGQSQAGDVALVFAQRLRLRLGLREIEIVDLEVGTAEQQTIAAGHADERERHAATGDVFDNFHGMVSRILTPLSPVLGGEGLGVGGKRCPLTPTPSPPSTGERGENGVTPVPP